MNRIPYGRQNITEDDLRAMQETLLSDFITTGPRVEEFESAFAEYVDSDYAVAVSNGTAALHLAMLTLKERPGKKVITSPITFLASANCIIYAGMEVDFADIDPRTFLIDLNKIEDKLRKDKKGSYAGIIPVDFAGYPVNTEDLRTLADKYSLWILEDSCHAPGGWFRDSGGKEVKCGSNMYSDLSIFSFHPVKHITAGEGGIITTNNKDYYNKLTRLRSHGTTKDPGLMTKNPGGWYYEMQELGYNYRLTDFQAALANSQLKRLDENIRLRKRIAARYDQAFENIDSIDTPFIEEQVSHAFHLYVIKTSRRKELYDYLFENNIFSQVHYIPVHLQPYYRELGWSEGDFPLAEAYYERCLSLPVYPTLSNDEQEYVIERVLEFSERY
ncbi:MAG: UDP-4-amino-4,6-dideoxy-N-acetyl-beta-L-altrosamine transaminase [Marinilabiliaceae bacterium]|jgi:UDP-4-amino-4,6-dideoxy-N-acetyl-beta-L-altrosamine transaminase|nr:UDP-4-amino-4,6-dideoxy-N-acetyl-beta-L-altrosamine transaminase [Marinilabiliaceae bacterium]